MQNLFKFGYEAARSMKNVPDHDCHSSPEDGCEFCDSWNEEMTLEEEHALMCDASSVDADGTCLICGLKDLI